MKTLTLVVVGLLACFFAQTSEAQNEQSDPSKTDDKTTVAKEIVKALNLKELDAETFHKNMLDRIDQQIPQMKIGDEAKKQLRAAMIESLKEITNDRLVEMLAKPYEDKFTIEQLRAIRDFYKSEAGIALLNAHQDLKKSQEEGKRLMTQELYEDFKKRLKDTQ